MRQHEFVVLWTAAICRVAGVESLWSGAQIAQAVGVGASAFALAQTALPLAQTTAAENGAGAIHSADRMSAAAGAWRGFGRAREGGRRG